MDTHIVIGHWPPKPPTCVGQCPKKGGARMINMLVDQTVIIDAPKAVLELLDDLKLLLIEHKITEEEFAVLYGYIYLARESLMTVEDVQFIMANTVGH